MAPGRDGIAFADRGRLGRVARGASCRRERVLAEDRAQVIDAREVTHAEALDVALTWGWIDAVRNQLDDDHFLQRFTPRTARSKWSKINRDKVEALTAAGRMKPAGLREVERAKADGRWDAAYDGQRTMAVPDDLQRELDARPEAAAFFARSTATTATRSSTGSRTRRSPRREPAASRSSSRCWRPARRPSAPGSVDGQVGVVRGVVGDSLEPVVDRRLCPGPPLAPDLDRLLREHHLDERPQPCLACRDPLGLVVDDGGACRGRCAVGVDRRVLVELVEPTDDVAQGRQIAPS